MQIQERNNRNQTQLETKVIVTLFLIWILGSGINHVLDFMPWNN